MPTNVNCLSPEMHSKRLSTNEWGPYLGREQQMVLLCLVSPHGKAGKVLKHHMLDLLNVVMGAGTVLMIQPEDSNAHGCGYGRVAKWLKFTQVLQKHTCNGL